MFKKIALLLLTSIFLVSAGCTSSGQGVPTSSGTINSGQVNTQPVNNTPTLATSPETQFGHMLSLVPYSFLEKQDIWFGDQEKVKQLYGFENINNLDSFNQLSAEKKKEFAQAMDGVEGLLHHGNWSRIDPSVSGFDSWMIDRTIFDPGIVPSPNTFTILEGSFNKDLITNNLMALGYQKVDYYSFSYLSINADYGFDSHGQFNPLAREVLSAMNRVSVQDNTLAAAPATKSMTDILETMGKKQKSVWDDPACRVLVTRMGDVLSGVILTPERVMSPGLPLNEEDIPKFQFEVPPDWGTLHHYDMAGMGYKDDGKERFWTISLYYKDAQAAELDSKVLVNRLNSYVFNTQFDQNSPGRSVKWQPLTDKYEVGQPRVQQYQEGSTLTVECWFKPGVQGSSWFFPLQIGPYRDILFLYPSYPFPYIKDGRPT